MTTTRAGAEPAHQERRVERDELAGRGGYEAEFLAAEQAKAVPLPSLPAPLRRRALVVDPRRRGLARHLLHYQHFSIAMHRDRRMAIFTAVNIDGAQHQRIKRASDRWAKDPRIPAAAQIGDELYANNQLDRGHLVRRLDPAWGEAAPTAERDTFFFTNCSPQHSRFNQALWVELENYLLESAHTLGFRACVFTGPLFSETDGVYRYVRVPGGYWKVAAMLRTDDGQLSATGYIVSQADLITGLEFAFGQVKTYQLSLGRLETLTGLDFGPLKAADPLRSVEGVEAREILSASDIQV